MTTILITVSLAAIAVAIAAAWMIRPEPPSPAMRRALAGRKYAHRGLYDNSGKAPENSMPAFKAAIAKGYGIELDIRLSGDGRVVVFHDAGLERMCGDGRLVSGCSFEELSSLRLLSSDERIPAFDDFLAAVSGAAPLLVEFKTGLPGGPGAGELCRKAMEALDSYEGDYVVESFDYAVLEWFRANRPAVMRGQLAMGLRCYVPAMGARAAAALPFRRRAMLSWLLYNRRGRPHFVSYRFQDAGLALGLCRALGAMSAAWTVKTPAEGASLARGWDAIVFEGYLP
ncbi:MAG: glycerophosphodiester phosphodiesterase [Spirochaetes bacterium]|nr:glycerophosphodiester phosphodiesterase [Spirochaetota bacterium]MBU1080034.1 glycerophosphodiester phosphodiesterase [Spirochaetota bacterium]